MTLGGALVPGGGFLIGRTILDTAAEEAADLEDRGTEQDTETNRAVDRLALGTAAIATARDCFALTLSYAGAVRHRDARIVELGAVQDRIADMAVRLYVAEGAARRTAGLIEVLLARLHAETPNRIVSQSRARDEYAIERAIVHLFGCETLRSVVGHALALLADYGPDHALEQACRAPRAEALLASVHETDRLTIPATVLERATSPSLPVRAFMKEVAADVASCHDDAMPTDGPLAREIHAVEQAKRLVAYTTRLVLRSRSVGMDLHTAQQMLLADMIVDVYAMESAVARTAARIHRRGEEKVKFERDLVAVFLADASGRLTTSARRIAADDEGDEAARHSAAIARLTPYLPLGLLDARTRIAENLAAADGCLI